MNYGQIQCSRQRPKGFLIALWSEVLCSCTQTVLTILIYFSHIDIFKAVHEGHINRSKIGNALLSEIVTVFFTHTCSFRCSTFFERPNKQMYISKQTEKFFVFLHFAMLRLFMNLYRWNLLTFAPLISVDAINNICSTY